MTGDDWDWWAISLVLLVMSSEVPYLGALVFTAVTYRCLFRGKH